MWRVRLGVGRGKERWCRLVLLVGQRLGWFGGTVCMALMRLRWERRMWGSGRLALLVWDRGVVGRRWILEFGLPARSWWFGLSGLKSSKWVGCVVGGSSWKMKGFIEGFMDQRN